MSDVPDGIVPGADREEYDITTRGYLTPEVIRSAAKKVIEQDYAARILLDQELLKPRFERDILPELFDDSDEATARRKHSLLWLAHNSATHLCNKTCTCPVHETALLYQAHGDEHACQDVRCVFGHGMNHRTWMPMIARKGVRAKFQKALAQAMAWQPVGRHPVVAQQHAYVAALREIGLTLAAPVDDLGNVVRLDPPSPGE